MTKFTFHATIGDYLLKILGLFYYMLALILRTDIYCCNICKSKCGNWYTIGSDSDASLKYRIIGSGKRKAGCYFCKSTDRERLIYFYLTNKLNLLNTPKDIKILHVAPEKMVSQLLIKSNFVNYYCIDLFTDGYTYPSYVKNMSVLDLEFNNNFFDLVICNHVLEHIVDDSTAMKELFRVLKNDGIAILQVPISQVLEKTIESDNDIDDDQRFKLFGQYDHVRVYGKDYIDRLKNTGFTVSKFQIQDDKILLSHGLNRLESIFIATKQS